VGKGGGRGGDGRRRGRVGGSRGVDMKGMGEGGNMKDQMMA